MEIQGRYKGFKLRHRWVTFWQGRKKTVKAYAIPRETEKAHSTWRTTSAKWIVGMIQQYMVTNATEQILRWKALEELNISLPLTLDREREVRMNQDTG